jgi:hypothetical protein
MLGYALMIGFGLGMLGAAAPAAQQAMGNDDWCRDESWGGDREGVCEVREFTLPASSSTLSVDASPNGGIQVEGSARADVHVRARVVATAETEARAREIANAVRISQTGDRISAAGPDGLRRREGWHVSYRLSVPTHIGGLSLRSTNGGIGISDVEARIEFRTTNGGVKLRSVGGEVRGRTTNGGVDVELDGATWRGEGLDVETSNGGVRLSIPEHYSAQLETGTVNGGMNIDFPLTVQGRIDRQINATLGNGGPYIRVRTSNGGLRITKK